MERCNKKAGSIGAGKFSGHVLNLGLRPLRWMAIVGPPASVFWQAHVWRAQPEPLKWLAPRNGKVSSNPKLNIDSNEGQKPLEQLSVANKLCLRPEKNPR